MDRLELQSRVTGVVVQGDRTVIMLDETIFYPQGGGQPYDQGMIVSPSARFRVEEVRFVDGEPRHIGSFIEGSLIAGDEVQCLVDEARRLLHSRIHSAGHVVDMAVTAMNLGWVPGKGYHFPEGPYVEYSGTLSGDIEQLKSEITHRCEEILGAGIETFVRFVDMDEMRRLCRFVPDNIPADKPARIVFYGDFGVPCGGTHVARLAGITAVSIRKVKQSRDLVRISYDVPR